MVNAVFSDDRVYRYTLERDVGTLLTAASGRDAEVLFVMLNPSTADEHVNDPTVRRCEDFACVWGYTKLTVCNLFALRSTDPRVLSIHPDPVGPDNDAWIRECAGRADKIIAAWGIHGKLYDRGEAVLDILWSYSTPHCLGLTADGLPKHPLYLAKLTMPQAMQPRVSALDG